MDDIEWIAKARELELEHQEEEGDLDPAILRKLLSDMHLLMLEAPATVYDQYRRLDEYLLIEHAMRRMDAIVAGDYGWLQSDGSMGGLLRVLATQIRAADQLLFDQILDDFGPPSQDAGNWLCQSSGLYVIPREYMRLDDPKRRQGQSYSRRGVLRHRLIPSNVSGLPVKVIWRNDKREAASIGEIKFGAALFRDFDLITRDVGESGFVAIGTNCRDQEATLALQVDAAHGDEACAGIVWPELTVGPEVLARISDLLRDRFMLEIDEQPLQVVVAGSWHEEDRGKFRNRATILDGYGDPRHRHRFDKLFAAQDAKGRFEEIVPGDHLPIFANDLFLAAFAICRDFCDRGGQKSLYSSLDVDFFLIPSMGLESTMRAHLGVAEDARIKSGSRTFVVQQAEPEAQRRRELGFVLPMLDRFGTVAVDDLKEIEVWSLHPNEKKAI